MITLFHIDKNVRDCQRRFKFSGEAVVVVSIAAAAKQHVW